MYWPICRGVAQPGSASGLGPEGRKFKSCRPDHLFAWYKVCAQTGSLHARTYS